VQQQATQADRAARPGAAQSSLRERPPKSIVAQVAGAHKQLVAEQARTRARTSRPGVNQGFCCVSTRARGGALARPISGVARPSPNWRQNDTLLDSAGPPLECLENQNVRESADRAHQAAIARLEAADGPARCRSSGVGSTPRSRAGKMTASCRPASGKHESEIASAPLKTAAVENSPLIVAGVAFFAILAGCSWALRSCFTSAQSALTESVKRLDALIRSGHLTEAAQFVGELENSKPRPSRPNADVQKRRRICAAVSPG